MDNKKYEGSKCFTCHKCGTSNCPSIEYDMADQRFGYGIADDMGLEKIQCKDCYYMTGKCEDCLFYESPECEEIMPQSLLNARCYKDR